MATAPDSNGVRRISIQTPKGPFHVWTRQSGSSYTTKVLLLHGGPSEFGAVGDCALKNWDRSADLPRITVPTLVMGARYDTMDPGHLRWMSPQFPSGRFHFCEHGSHLSIYDDQDSWFGGLIDFLKSASLCANAFGAS
jgi:proline iminopeptidase